ncbi:hypothetical protein LSCM1_02499 [Leishmania martiniquensis]|uniref:tRNA-specific adenosine deaminase 1 n=1 Tax=Leishmania martiniquensis TaxID=1580590 RepID=A0A836GBY1_9TRYP|nr:hypothetical protein LSCM1_02499 [Leishmania martiniquensis]
MEGSGASTSAERAAPLSWIAPGLWSDTPHGAVHRAVEAQPQPLWRWLWQQALADGARRPGPSCAVADAPDQEAGTEGKGDVIIVAAFVLSIPLLECPCAEDAALSERSVKASARRYVCVSLGSGSRCLAAHDAPPSDAVENVRRRFELRDGHAEVMARRGFIAFLLEMAEADARCGDRAFSDPFLRRRNGYCSGAAAAGFSSGPQWELRETAAVHLVCTRWMCGSLAAVAGRSGRSGHLLLRAACGCWLDSTVRSEVSESDSAHESPPVTRVGGYSLAAHHSPLNGAAPLLYAARVKPGKGRANLSMSCTDKVWRWCALGVQGHRRASLFPVPMRLSSIHILWPPPGDDGDMRAAADDAAATFQWRSRRWWPHADRDETAPPAPGFAFFSSAEFAVARPSAAAWPPDSNLPSDSSYSRSRWLCVRSAAANRKRGRGEEAGALTSGEVTCSWQFGHSAGDYRCSLVLNTKAGLPQGMTGRALARLSCTFFGSLWQQCPLSRPWMGHRVQRLQAAHKEAALISPSLTLSAASASCSSAETGECGSHSITSHAEGLSMSQRVHRCHLQPSCTEGDSVRFLWASSPQIGCPDSIFVAAEKREATQ